jgi:DNA-binding CsgD family transcriptional regulator
LLVFRDPEQHDPTVGDRLKGLYHLSNAEADLAMGLAQGASLADTAERRGVRESTVRSQMKTLAAKMNRHRQGEIIAAVAALPPLPPKGSRPADFPHLGDAGNVSQR